MSFAPPKKPFRCWSHSLKCREFESPSFIGMHWYINDRFPTSLSLSLLFYIQIFQSRDFFSLWLVYSSLFGSYTTLLAFVYSSLCLCIHISTSHTHYHQISLLLHRYYIHTSVTVNKLSSSPSSLLHNSNFTALPHYTYISPTIGSGYLRALLNKAIPKLHPLPASPSRASSIKGIPTPHPLPASPSWALFDWTIYWTIIPPALSLGQFDGQSVKTHRFCVK